MKTKYTFSFTAASALINETRTVAEHYIDIGDWHKTEEYIGKRNLLKKVKGATFKREFSEIKKRLKNLSDKQLRELVNGDLHTSKLIIYIAIVKTYEVIYDFIVDVLRTKVMGFDMFVLESDYSRFLSMKSDLHPEITGLSEKTQYKIKQVLFYILTQLGIVSDKDNKKIVRQLLPKNIEKIIVQDDANILKAFFYTDSEIKEALKQIH